MAVDPKLKETTPPSDKEWISRAVASMPDPAVTPRASASQPAPSANAARPANDDRQSIGELLRSLQLRPSYSGFAVAGALSVAWILLGGALAYFYLPDLPALLGSPAAVPALIGLGALAVVPISLVFTLAHMRWRARELRLVTESMASLALRLAEPQATAQETITQLGDQMRREINIMTTGMERAMERAGELERRVNGQVAALERAHREAENQAKGLTDRLAEHHGYVTAQADQVRDAVDAARGYSEKAAAMMQSLVAETEGRVETQMRVLSQNVESALTRFQQAVENRSRAVDDNLGTRAHDMMKSVHESGKDLAAALDRRVKDASVIIEARTTEIEETIGAKIEQLDKTLQHRLVTIAETLDARIAGFEDVASGRAHETAMQIEIQTRAAAELLDNNLSQLTQALRTSTTEASGLIDSRTKAASEALVSRMQQIAQAIDSRSTEARQSLGQLANDIEHKIVELCTHAGAALSEDAVTVESKLSGLSTSITAAITQNVEYVERTLLSASTEASRGLAEQAEQLSATISEKNATITAHGTALAAKLDANNNELVKAMERTIANFASEVMRANANAVSLVDSRGAAFTRAVSENSERVIAELSTASETAIKSMREVAHEAEDGIKAAIERGRETTASSLGEMRETHSVLRSEGISLFERLREANILLREALTGSQENMASLEKALGERLHLLEEAVETFSTRGGAVTAELSSHVGSFQDSGLRVLEDLTRLAAQFESHSHSLVQTVELIDTINRRTLDTVSERSTSMESVIASLDAKTLDFGERLARFSALLNESLETASERARDIGLLIAESSSTGVRAISDQYEIVRATVDQEGQRTAEMLRGVYQSVVGEAHTNLQQASDRFIALLRGIYSTTVGDAQTNLQQASTAFTELVEGIRRMAADMQRELETTRDELRRGVLEIPREAADNITQMRSVIAGQIEALAELNRIVAGKGEQAPPKRIEGTTAARPERQISFAPAPRPAARQGQPAPLAADAAPVPVAASVPPPQEPVLAAPVAQASPTPGNAAQAKIAQAKQSWLTDLLSRVGADPLPPERAAPAQTIQSLDGLAADIARMVDENSLGDAWNRYNRGDQNVFTRRLYTAQGQRAFDEIRTRYKSEPDFKHTVDRYMGEFERLIGDVSRDEEGRARVRTYLTSETGKVYTMLAHAAGRLD